MIDAIQTVLHDPVMGKIVTVVIGMILIAAVIKTVQRVSSRRIADAGSRYRVRKLVAVIGYVLAVFFLSIVFKEKLGGLTVALGVAGAGIAFALQEVIVSTAGWIALSFGGYFKTGDRVQLGGIKGDVIDIGILRTTLMECGEWIKGDLYTGRIVRIANSFVFKEPVFNYSGDFPFLWDEVRVPVKHGCDMALARRLLQQVVTEVAGEYSAQARGAWDDIVRKYLIENAQVEPMVTLVATDNWLEFTVRYVVDYKKRRSTRDRLFVRMVEEFNKTEGAICFASTTIQIVDPPTVPIRISQSSGDERRDH